MDDRSEVYNDRFGESTVFFFLANIYPFGAGR